MTQLERCALNDVVRAKLKLLPRFEIAYHLVLIDSLVLEILLRAVRFHLTLGFALPLELEE